jgi:hypothetical protein
LEPHLLAQLSDFFSFSKIKICKMVCPNLFANYSFFIYTPQLEVEEVNGFLGL